MTVIDSILVLAVAALHGLIFYKEAFDWDGFAKKLMPEADASFLERTRSLGLNQGVYNLILAIALVSSIWTGQGTALLFLACVVGAGIIGAMTVSPAIAKAQALPGGIAFVGVLLF